MAVRTATAALVAVFLSFSASRVDAQGLLFSLPEDGMSVEYEGKLTQETLNPDSPDGVEKLSWDRELTIRSVGSEMADFRGSSVPCRWIEIKTVTGTAGAAGMDPGPVGSRLYKILVPESVIIGQPQDADNIPNQVLPIITGFRRTGENAAVPLKAAAIRFYPTICLLANYSEPQTLATAEVPEIIAEGLSVSARHLQGEEVIERPESRSTNKADYWVSDQVPFGLARWIVTIEREIKESAAPRSDFKKHATVSVDMKLRRIRTDAESELVTN